MMIALHKNARTTPAIRAEIAASGDSAAALALPNPLNALEEPLAIYWGQYRFEREVRGMTLSSQSSWYVQPHADRAAKAIAAAFPADQPAPVVSEGPLLQAAASVCE